MLSWVCGGSKPRHFLQRKKKASAKKMSCFSYTHTLEVVSIRRDPAVCFVSQETFPPAAALLHWIIFRHMCSIYFRTLSLRCSLEKARAMEIFTYFLFIFSLPVCVYIPIRITTTTSGKSK